VLTSALAGGKFRVAARIYDVGVDPATLTRIKRPTRSPYLDAAEIQPVIDVLVKYKTIPKAFSAVELISPYALKPPK
jgi:hypothetical protein